MVFYYGKRIVGKVLMFISSKIEDLCNKNGWLKEIFVKDKGAVHSLCTYLYNLKWYRDFVFKKLAFISLKSPLLALPKAYLFFYCVLMLFLSLMFFGMVWLICYWVGVAFSDSHGKLKIDSIISMLSAIGTAFAAIFAAKSAKGVFLSNKSIENNSRAEAFDRVFSVLIEQHGSYLKKINEYLVKPDVNFLFSIEYLSSLNFSESIDIIRGLNKCVFEGEESYFIKHGELVWRNAMLHEQKANNELEYLKVAIVEGNSFAKNVLSPYMRVLYHLLKAINEAYGSENERVSQKAKQYSNIVRSVIPNDVLFLIALNSADFLHHRNHLNFLQSEPECFFNDYKKFYNLLIKYDFFEHLYMLGIDEVFNSKYFVGATSKSVLGHCKDSFDRVKFLKGQKGVGLKESGVYGFSDLIQLIAKEIRKENTLLCLYYFYGLGDAGYRVRKYFKNKYILQVVDEINDFKDEGRRFTYYMVGSDKVGKIVLVSDTYLEMLISGVVG